MGLYHNLEFIQIMKKNCIQEFFLRHERGCSDSYKLLMKAHLRDENIEPPRALSTASASYNFPFKQKQWIDSLKNISKQIALPHTSTMILKKIYRQNWTPLKQGLRTKDLNDQYCKFCLGQTVANSKHIFLECPVAIQAWTFLNALTQELFEIKQEMTLNIIFMLNIPASSNSEKCVILDLSATILHFLHKLHFKDLMRDNELENFLYRCLLRTIYANRSAGRNLQYFEKIYHCLERLLKKSFILDF